MFNAGLFDELTPLFPDTDVSTGVKEYTIAGANGSYAGVHIAVSGLTPGLPLSFEIKGPHRCYKLFELIAVPVEVNTGADNRSEYLKNDHNDHVIRRAPFYVYDALKPVFNMIRPQFSMAAFAFRMPVEYCRKITKSQWTVTLSHGGEQQTLILNVEEYPVSIPRAGKDTFKFVNWFNFDNIEKFHHVRKWSAQYEIMLEKYLRAAHYTRQNIFAIPPEEIFDLDENGSPVLNEAHLSTLIRIARAAGLELFSGNAFCARAEGIGDNDDFYNSLPHDTFTSPDDVAMAFRTIAFDLFDHGEDGVFCLTHASLLHGSGQEHLRRALTQLNSFIRKNDLADVWVQSCMDEPNDMLCGVYKIIADITKEIMPGIPVLEPVLPTEKVKGLVDIWCPTVKTYETNRDFFEQRVAEGDRLFVYTCLTPGGNYMNRLLDMERLRPLYLAWMPLVYPSIEGFLHWGANQGTTNPFERQAAMFTEQVLEYHPKYANFLPAGDICIFYPGFDEPLVSTRSEAHRIGLEDHYILKALSEKAPDAVDEIVHSVVRGFADYSKSVEDYRKAKKALLEKAAEAGI